MLYVQEELVNMAQKYGYLNKSRLKIALLTGSSLLFLFSVTTPKTFADEGKQHEVNTTVLFQPPPGEKPPEDTEGGGARDNSNSCDRDIVNQRSKSAGDRNNLTAIAPVDYDGLTTVSHPTFWIDLPETSAQQAILLIKEGDNSNWHQLATHSQQSIDVEGKAGIIGIELAQDAPALEVGKNYQWIVTLVCSDRPDPNDPLVSGGIKRVDESQITMNVPTTLTQLDRASLYAEKGIWYDALAILVGSKSSLSDWNNIWVEYLQSGGLADDVARKPVIGELK